MIIQGGWSDLEGGHAIMYLVDRDFSDNWGFCVVNTGEGIEYHPGTWDTVFSFLETFSVQAKLTKLTLKLETKTKPNKTKQSNFKFEIVHLQI